VVATAPVTNTEQVWQETFMEGLDVERFSVRLEGIITAPETGSYRFGVITGGKSRLYLDGALLLDNWIAQKPSDNYFGMAGEEVAADVPLEKGRKYAVVMEYSSESATGFAVNRLGCRAPIPADAIQRAAALAAGSDVAVVFVGLSDEWDSEGFDRPDMELPGEQNALVAAVAAANPRTVIVLNVTAGHDAVAERCGRGSGDVVSRPGAGTRGGRRPLRRRRAFGPPPADVAGPARG
jgi:beta-glucosidase